VTNRRLKASSSQVRQWDKGEPLSFAWFAFATPATRREYQTCEIDSRRMSHRLDMKFQVLDDLMRGNLIAWGFREGAPVDEGPALIPGHLFPRDGDDTAAVDWEISTLRSSGFSFVRIRVTKPRTSTPRKKRTSAPESKRAKPSPVPPLTPPPTPLVSEPAKKKGRPRVDEALRAVIRSLVETGQLKDKSRKVQIEIIRASARAAHPTLFLRETQPSRDKIFAALRAEGLIGPM